MGILRKVISGTMAVGTGGLSLMAVQYRSDTERGTRATKQLRNEVARQNANFIPGYETQQFAPLPMVSYPVIPPAAPVQPSKVKYETLRKAADLRRDGAITEGEFQALKKSILES